MNQGLYNGFLAAGLFWGLVSKRTDIKVFFLACVVVAGVFGGITACDAVANGIVGALNTLGDKASKPQVVRLDGNNVEEGRKILADFNHPLVSLADTMDGGADAAAELANR